MTLRRRIAQRTAIQNPVALLSLALIFLLALPLLWFSLIAAPAIRVEVGMRGDDTYLSGFNEPEKNSTETFRWTGGASRAAAAEPEQPLPGAAHPRPWLAAGRSSIAGGAARSGRATLDGHPDPARPADLPRAAAARCRQPNDRCRLCDAGLLHAERRPRAGLRAGLAGAARAGSIWPARHFWQFGGQALLLRLALLLLGLLALPWRLGGGSWRRCWRPR